MSGKKHKLIEILHGKKFEVTRWRYLFIRWWQVEVLVRWWGAFEHDIFYKLDINISVQTK